MKIAIGNDHVAVEMKQHIKKYLEEFYIEGIVFWKDGEPKCKIKRSDFGYEWNQNNEKYVLDMTGRIIDIKTNT